LLTENAAAKFWVLLLIEKAATQYFFTFVIRKSCDKILCHTLSIRKSSGKLWVAFAIRKTWYGPAAKA